MKNNSLYYIMKGMFLVNSIKQASLVYYRLSVLAKKSRTFDVLDKKYVAIVRNLPLYIVTK